MEALIKSGALNAPSDFSSERTNFRRQYLIYCQGNLGVMTEKMQADNVPSRKARFIQRFLLSVRCVFSRKQTP